MKNKTDIIISQIEELAKLNIDSNYRLITLLSNLSALLYQNIEDINWLGFYILENGNLILGPFQGKVACTYIEKGKGVCGYTIEENKVVYVKNVHEFKGHIACDSSSNSELVLPIYKNKQLFGLLDIDSTKIDRFSNVEIEEITKIANAISSCL